MLVGCRGRGGRVKAVRMPKAAMAASMAKARTLAMYRGAARSAAASAFQSAKVSPTEFILAKEAKK